MGFPVLDDRHTEVAFDLETRDNLIKSHGPGWCFRGAGTVSDSSPGYVVGVAVAWGDEQTYLPLRHEGGGNLDPDQGDRWLRDLLKNDRITKVAHNAVYDLGWGLTVPDSALRGPVVDTMFATALLDENRFKYGLDEVGFDYLGERKDEAHMKIQTMKLDGVKESDWKGHIWRLPGGDVHDYAAQDAGLTLRLWRHMHEQIIDQDLGELFLMETDLIPMVVAMRKEGIRIDLDRAEQLADEWETKLEAILKELKRQLGFMPEPWSPKSLTQVFEERGLEIKKTAKGNPSFPKEFIRQHPDPVVQLIGEYRKFDKNRRDYIITNLLEGNIDGRVHPETNLLKSETSDGSTKGTVSGRISVTNPALQQQPSPKRDPVIGRSIRSLFLPEEGESWGSADYSQQEPRLQVHYSILLKLKGAAEAQRKYINDPRTDYHQMVCDMAGDAFLHINPTDPRSPAKDTNLGLTYGMGEVKLCRELGLPVVYDERRGREVAGPEGRELFDTYHARVPFVRALTERCSNLADARGYIKTILGRRCRFPLWEPARYSTKKVTPLPWAEANAEWPNTALKRAFTYKAMNRLIQGGSADQTKRAMWLMWQAGVMPKLQMHDEINISYGEERELRLMVDAMEHAVDLTVPTVIDVEVGPSWGECKEITL